MVVFYSWFGSHANLTFANSSWTKNHLDHLWSKPKHLQAVTLYPPCDIHEFGEAKNVRGEGNRNAENIIVSFA